MLVLIGLRNMLREKNLYDTGRGPLDQPNIDDHPRYLTARTLDGTFNNLDDPLMGSLGSRFGRNVPLNATVRESDPLEPNPRLVARELLTRDEFIPATTLNLLGRRVDPVRGARLVQPRQERDREPVARAARRRRPVAARSRCRSRARGATRRRTATGRRRSSPTTRIGGTGRRSTGAILRSPSAIKTGEHGKLHIDDRGLIPDAIESHVDLTGVAGNFWVGLALLHSLFMREHNAVCDHLHATHPELSDDELFDKARLVVSALMAKIHTVDWTPGDHRAPDDGDRTPDELVGRSRAAGSTA